jgi:type 1 glutamine amidotransferase
MRFLCARPMLAALVGLWALASAVPAQAPRVLIFHKQNGFIHTATPDVVASLKSNWTANGLAVESTTDSLAFTAQNLARFKAVVFLNTNYRTAPLLARSQEAVFEDYLHAGGSFVGIHSAVPLNGTYEETVWPWYATLFGARFRSHSPYRSAPLVFEDRNHASTRGLPARITLQDEWYAVQVNPRTVAGIHVIATADETGFLADSYMGGDHPMTWSRTFEGARAWMTLVGHDMAAFSNANFQTHVRNGVVWAALGDTATTALRALRPATRLGKRGTLLSYEGRHGERVELRLDGRSVRVQRKDAPARRRP